MALDKNIKGIIVEIGGDTAKLNDALNNSGKQTKSLQSELTAIDKLLKFDPTNVELLTQKQKLLADQVETCRDKVNALKQAQEQVKAMFANGDIDEGAYRNFERQLVSAEQQLQRVQNSSAECNSQLESAGAGTSKFSAALTTAGAAAAAAAVAIAGLAKGAKEIYELSAAAAAYADNVITISNNTHLATDTIQELQYMAELTDTSLDTITKAVAKNTKSMSEARDGTEKYAEAYEKLDVNITNADGSLRDSYDVFLDSIDALGEIANETERDAIAMDIFGKSAQELNSLVAAGSETLRQYGEEAKQMGAVLTDEQLSSLGALDDQIQRLTKFGETVKTTFGAELAPAVSSILEMCTNRLPDAAYAVNTFAEYIADMLSPSLTQQAYNLADGYEALCKQADRSITAAENEIIVIETKASRYEELRTQANLTATEEEELKRLAEDLQAILPETTKVIDTQTGSYNSCAAAVKQLSENMREQAVIQAYSDKLTAAAQAAADAQSKIIDANFAIEQEFTKKKVTDPQQKELILQYTENPVIVDALKAKDEAQKLYDEAIADQERYYNEIDKIQNGSADKFAELERMKPTVITEVAEQSTSIIAEYEKAKGIAAREAAEEYSQSQLQAIKDYETKTQEAVDNIEKRYKLHQTTEKQYYSELEAYLSGHVNNQSTLYWELTDKVSDYYDKQAKAAETSAAKTAKSAETQSNKELSTAKSKLSKLLDLYKKGSISAEEYNKEYTALLAEYSEHQVELTEIAQEKMTEITEAEATKRVEALKKSIEQEIAEYQKEYEAVQKQIESFANSVGKSYKDMYTFETDEKTGKLVAKTTDKMIQGQKEAQKYLDNINKLQDRGVSNTMLQQLTTMSREEGIATAEYWMSLTDQQLKNLDGNWRKYTKINKQISEALYEDEAKSTAKSMLNAIGTTLAESDTELKDTGLKILQSIANGVLDEAGMSEIKAICDGIISTMTEYFSDSKANITLDASVNEGKASAAKSTGKAETSTAAADYTEQYMNEVYAKNTSSGNKEIVLPDVSSVRISTLAVTNETEKAKKQDDHNTNITKKIDEIIAAMGKMCTLLEKRQTIEATFYITTSTDIDGNTFSKMVTDVVRKELK